MTEKHEPLYQADWLKLLPVLVLAFYVSFIPHLDYAYPLHIDEWVQMALSKAMMGAHTTTFADPFLGNSTVSLSSNLEAGFQLFIGFAQQISGISWETLFRYFPSVVSVITVLGVYVLAKRHGFGWEAALLAALIPTSVGILGPAFLLPVSLGLLFIPMALFVAFHIKTRAAYVILFVFSTLLLAIHAPSAVLLVVIMVPYLLLNLKGDFKHSAGIFVALVLPFLMVFPWIFDLLLPTAKALLQRISSQDIAGWTSYTDIPAIFGSYGYIPIALCLLGVFILFVKGGREKSGLVLALLALLAMLSVFFTLHYGVWILYLRGLIFALLMIGIIAGAGLAAIKNIRLPERIARFPLPRSIRSIGYPLCLAVIILTLAIAIPALQNANYYHLIDQGDYQAFDWIQKNVPAKYGKAIVDPLKATAFTALSGKNTYSRIHATVSDTDRQAQAFLNGLFLDTSFLQSNGISVVYTRQPVGNVHLIEVYPNVYLLPR